MYPAAVGGEREAKVTPFADSHEGRGRMPDPEFYKTLAAASLTAAAESGRTTRATSAPSFMKISVGHNFT